MQNFFQMNHKIKLYEKLASLTIYILCSLHVIYAFLFEWFTINFHFKVKQVKFFEIKKIKIYRTERVLTNYHPPLLSIFCISFIYIHI